MEEKEKLFLEYLKKVAPGTQLRTVIGDLLRSDLGALIVFDSPELTPLIEGGFRINCRFSPQRLFELCKMDGGIVVSADLKRILHANVLLAPDHTIPTNETGTRHKAAERTAKQANTFVIAISERRKKTTLYLQGARYYLRTSDELQRDIGNTLQVLEKQRELFDELLNKLNILEISNLVSAGDVCKLVQKSEMMLKNSETIKKDLIEIGKEGSILNLRYKELMKGIEKKEEEILRDYSKIALRKTKKLLDNLSFEGLMDLDTISRLVFEKTLDESVSPRGFRFLSNSNLNEKEVSLVVEQFANLNEILNDDTNKIESVLKHNSGAIRENMISLKEQIIEGKRVI